MQSSGASEARPIVGTADDRSNKLGRRGSPMLVYPAETHETLHWELTSLGVRVAVDQESMCRWLGPCTGLPITRQ